MKKSLFITTLCAAIAITTFATQALAAVDQHPTDSQGNLFTGTRCGNDSLDSKAPGYQYTSTQTATGDFAQSANPNAPVSVPR